ncbi:MAG: HAD family hydrolase [Salinivirgaceae bacterium]|nr:MAG: HAD family hydrolase [Salinivirgaceae bacterium]
MSRVKILAFDADDTLWNNETFFREAEKEFFYIMKDYLDAEALRDKLYQIEVGNLDIYGYGIKSFILSMIETASAVTNNQLPGNITKNILDIARQMLHKPVELLDGVEETLDALAGKYKMIIATKGDLLDQQRKLKKSNLAKYFDHVEIMTDKQTSDYENLLHIIQTDPAHFFMTGNSLKSDILPVLELGGYAMHVPYHTTWLHEEATEPSTHNNFYKGSQITDLLGVLT